MAWSKCEKSVGRNRLANPRHNNNNNDDDKQLYMFNKSNIYVAWLISRLIGSLLKFPISLVNYTKHLFFGFGCRTRLEQPSH